MNTHAPLAILTIIPPDGLKSSSITAGIGKASSLEQDFIVLKFMLVNIFVGLATHEFCDDFVLLVSWLLLKYLLSVLPNRKKLLVACFVKSLARTKLGKEPICIVFMAKHTLFAL